jgi:tRNA A37 threonylcarbamoyladenosine synthetase subunit TsaC/SUA5/YrdC
MNRVLSATERFDHDFTDQEVVDAVSAVRQGGLALLKGDIGYGLFGITEAALRKMYEIKGRPYSNPCICITNLDILSEITRIPDPRIREWIIETAKWTTLAVVLPANPESRLLSRLPPWVYGQTVTNGTLAAFINPGTFLERVIALAREQGFLIMGSSGNPSSHGNIYEFHEVPEKIAEAVDFRLDHGRAKYANPERKATTIVNFTNWTVKRRGVNWERIEPSFYQLAEQIRNS